MPKVKQSAFCCPECGKPANVLRTRAATSTRLVRYRLCENGHRFTTKEIVATEPLPSEHAIGTTRIQFALQNLAAELGIEVDSH